jgi:hypothetical protein
MVKASFYGYVEAKWLRWGIGKNGLDKGPFDATW